MSYLSRSSFGFYFCILQLAFCILTLNCFNPFSPSVTDPDVLVPTAPIAAQLDPDSVLQNFRYAYESRDSIVYENCLDEDFSFTYWDQSIYGEGEVEKVMTRPEDLRATKAIFRSFDHIQLTTWKITSAYDDAVGEEIRKVRNVTFHLSLWDTDGDYDHQHLEATGYAEFWFKQSPKDNLWRIWRWIDRSVS